MLWSNPLGKSLGTEGARRRERCPLFHLTDFGEIKSRIRQLRYHYSSIKFMGQSIGVNYVCYNIDDWLGAAFAVLNN